MKDELKSADVTRTSSDQFEQPPVPRVKSSRSLGHNLIPARPGWWDPLCFMYYFEINVY